MPAILKVRTSTRQSVKAVNALKGSWTEASSAVDLFGRGLSAVTGAFTFFIDQGKKLENINLAIKSLGPGGKATFTFLNNELGGTVDKMLLAQETARLMSDDLGIGLSEISTFYKYAVYKGRQVGLEAGEAIRTMTDTVLSGSAGTWERFGLRITGASNQIDVVKEALRKVKLEVDQFGPSWVLSAETMSEQTTKMKNSVTDMLSKMTLFGKGFTAAKDLMSFVSDKMGKSQQEIWDTMQSSMESGVTQISKKVYRYMQQIDTKRAELATALAKADSEGIGAEDEARIDGLRSSLRILQNNIINERKILDKMKGNYDFIVEKVGSKNQKDAYAQQGLAGYGQLKEALGSARTEAQEFEQALKLLNTPAEALKNQLMEIRGLTKDANWDERNLKYLDMQIEGTKKLISQYEEIGVLTLKEIDNLDTSEEEKKKKRDSFYAYGQAQIDVTRLGGIRLNLEKKIAILEQSKAETARQYRDAADKHLILFGRSLDNQIKMNVKAAQYTSILGNSRAAEKTFEAVRKKANNLLRGQLTLAREDNDAKKQKLILMKLEQVGNTKTLKQIREILYAENKSGRNESGSDPWKQQKIRLKYIKAINKATTNPLVLKTYEKEFNYLSGLIAANWRRRKGLEQTYKITNEIFKIEQKQRDEQASFNKSADAELAKALKLEQDRDVLLKKRILELNTIKIKTGAAFSSELQQELNLKKQLYNLDKADGLLLNDKVRVNKEIAATNKTNAEQYAEAAKKASDDAREKFKNSLLYSKGAAGPMDELIKEEQRKLQDAKNNADEVGQRRAENRIRLLQTEADKTARLKAEYGSLFTAASEAKGIAENVGKASIEAALMENSALKKLGKTRMQVVKEAVAAVLKAKALEYGVKAIGSAAEGTIALVTAPPAAPAFFKAAGLYTAAALAAGVAYKGLSKGASSSGAGRAATTQAPAFAGTAESGTNIYVTVTESVLGNFDSVMDQIKSGISKGQDKGTISAWGN